MKRYWYYEETPCYPKKFKVKNDGYRDDNASIYFFKTTAEAQAECDRRNKMEESQ